MTAVAVPDDLRQTVLRWFGAEGERWLAEVPGEALRLADRWRLRLGAPYAGGTNALVVAVATEDGQPAVLKIPIRDEENYHEAVALRAYDGDGAVRLLSYEESTGAMLLERADPGAPLSATADLYAAIDVAAGVMRRLRRPAPSGVRLARVTDVAARWAATLPELRGQVPGELAGLVDEAVALASSYAAAPAGPELLVNRDAHLQNILRAGRQRWLLIDPKPMIGEAAFEAGHPVLNSMRQRPLDPAEVDRLVIRWAMGLGVDPARVRGWALVRAVQNVQWALSIGDDPSTDLAEARALAAGFVAQSR
jgi:streptomycin 6-kinase